MSCRWLPIAVLVAAVSASPAAAQGQNALVITGDALFGVDELGRVLLAVDGVPVDGVADHCFLFTATERLAGGPWSERVSNAVVVYNDAGSLSLRDSPPSHLVSLALEAVEPPGIKQPPFAEVLAAHEGIELVKLDVGEEGGALLDDMDIADLSTWPEPFWYDLLDPASGPCSDDSDCQAGGMGASSCSIGGCGPLQTQSCNVTCGLDTYACCKCLGLAQAFRPQCRCLPCFEP